MRMLVVVESGKILTSRHRATLQPSVPAPNSTHFICLNLSNSRSGRCRHRISDRFKSTADSACFDGSIVRPMLTCRGAGFLLCSFTSQPITAGIFDVSAIEA